MFIYHSNLFLCMRVFRPSCGNAMFITEMYTSGKNRNNLRVQFAELRHTWKLLFWTSRHSKLVATSTKLLDFRHVNTTKEKQRNKRIMPLSSLVCSILVQPCPYQSNPVWSSMIQFGPIWSNMIQFDQIQ